MGVQMRGVLCLLVIMQVSAYDGCISCMQKASSGLLPNMVQMETEVTLSTRTQKYHDTQTILSSISSLASSCASLSVREVSVGSCTRQVATLSSGDTANKKRILVSFSMHGRELISSETALFMAQKACDATQNSGLVNDALSNAIIDFVPVVNIAGRQRADNPGANPEHTCTNMRKNTNMVDLNRNFDFEFQSRSDTSTETYPGTGPMSECETQMLRDLAIEQKNAGHAYDAYLDVHSGEDAMGHVYGASKSLADSLDAGKKNNMLRITNKINDDVFAGTSLGKRWTGSLVTMGGAAAYESKGCASDYMFAVQNIPVSMTWEIWRQPTTSKKKKSDVSLVQAPPTYAPVEDGSAAVTTNEAADGVLMPFSAAASTSTENDGVVAAMVPKMELVSSDPSPSIVDAAPESSQSSYQDFDDLLNPSYLIQQEEQASIWMDGLDADQDAISSAAAATSMTAKLQVGTSAEHGPISLVQGDMSADQCFRYFNPETDSDYDNTVREWSDAILTLAKEV